MEEILLIGGGGHCKSVIDVIEQEGRFSIAGIIDKRELLGQEVLGYKVIGSDDDLEKFSKKYKYAFITVGQIHSNTVRVKLFKILKKLNYQLPVIISPLAYVSRYATVDEGSIVMHHALVNADAHVGKNSIINSKALIEHDSSIGDHCHISTATVINGGVKVIENSFVGSNSTTKEYCVIDGFMKAGEVLK